MKKIMLSVLLVFIVFFISSCSYSNIYREYKAICETDGVYFTSLQEAVDYVSASNSTRGVSQQEVNKEITLIRNVDESIRPEKRGGVVISSNLSETIVFDFKGYSYLLSDNEIAIKIDGESSVVLKNGKVNSPKPSSNAAIDIKEGSLEIENFSIIIPKDASFASLNGATLTVEKGAELSGKLALDGSSSLLVKGGSITLTELKEDSSNKGSILIYSGNIASSHDLEERVKEALEAVPDEDRGEINVSSIHSIKFIPEKAPLCSEYGNIAYYHCSSCGKSFSDSEGEHPITEEEIKIAPLGHDYVKVEAVEPTCKENGNTLYWICTRCETLSSDGKIDGDISKEDTVVSALGHDWSPLMHNNESHWKECNRCGELGFYENHSLSDWIPSEKEGYSYRTCDKCDFIEEKSDCEIEHVSANTATCTEDGNKEYWYCKVHHDYFLDENLTIPTTKEDVVINKKGHDLREKYTTSSSKHWLTCNNCNEIIDEEAHSWECYTDGDSHWQTCAVCKKTMVAMDYASNEEGHWYECWINHDYKYTELVPHNYEQKGNKLVCQQCGYEINKTGEDSGFDVVPVNPTPSGNLYYSRNGMRFEFTLTNTNPNSVPTSYIWTVNSEENKRGEENTFEFIPPENGYYTIRCIFLNDNGAASASVSISAF